MRRVIIESPFAATAENTVARNLRYLRAALRDCLMRSEAPFASHAIYTQPGVLDDARAVHRELGMVAGFVWRDVAEASVVYTDLGISPGMQAGIDHAQAMGHAVEYRQLGDGWEDVAVFYEALFQTRWP